TAKHTSGQGIRQRLIHQRKGREPARKSIDHYTPLAEHSRAIPKACRVIANMLDDGSGHDEVGRAVPERKTVRCRVGNDLVVDPTVAAQLLLGHVERHDEMRTRRVDVGQEWALLAPAD